MKKKYYNKYLQNILLTTWNTSFLHDAMTYCVLYHLIKFYQHYKTANHDRRPVSNLFTYPYNTGLPIYKSNISVLPVYKTQLVFIKLKKL